MKTIVVRDEVYELLRKMKKEGESFSDVILRLAKGRRGDEVLKKYVGSLAGSDLPEFVLKERLRLREFDL